MFFFMHVFLLIGSWEGEKNLRVEIFLNKKLVRVGLQETNTNNFFRPKQKLCLFPIGYYMLEKIG